MTLGQPTGPVARLEALLQTGQMETRPLRKSLHPPKPADSVRSNPQSKQTLKRARHFKMNGCLGSMMLNASLQTGVHGNGVMMDSHLDRRAGGATPQAMAPEMDGTAGCLVIVDSHGSRPRQKGVSGQTKNGNSGMTGGIPGLHRRLQAARRLTGAAAAALHLLPRAPRLLPDPEWPRRTHQS